LLPHERPVLAINSHVPTFSHMAGLIYILRSHCSHFSIMSSLLSLPQELIDMIIDFLLDDKQALKACSLTSRAFLAASRLHLFTQMRLATVGRHSDNRRDPLLANFLFLFINSSPSILPFVRSLRIDSVEPSGDATPYDMRNLKALPKLKSLSVTGTVFDPALSLPPPEPWCRQITSLSMDSQGFCDFDKFAAFIVLFTSLERLALNNMLWFFGHALDSHCGLPSTLHTLDLQSCNNLQLLEWLLLHDPMPSLHTIVLTYQDLNELFVVTNKICLTLGPSLRHFKFIYTGVSDHQCTLWSIFAVAS
jgi:hypothetical protein